MSETKAVRYEKAVIALLTHGTDKEAAKFLGVTPLTLTRYRKDPAFIEELARARREVYSAATAYIQSNMVKAAQTLVDVLSDEDAPATAKVSAAKCLLEFGADAYKTSAIEDRITSIEAAIAAAKKPDRLHCR